jgi:uncharacterized membrane protein YhaH (DUF805 family)
MLDLFAGRLDRKSYFIGNGLALAMLLGAVLIIVVPIAILDLLINNNRQSDVFSAFYLLAVIPGGMWYFFFMILMVRRLHDLGYPGLIAVILFTLIEAFGRIMDLWILNLLGILFIGLLCVLPGQRIRNKFGNKPPRRFQLAVLKPNVG